ncbi:MAG TPA: geranylgeranyl reductase family protein [Bryobacteraceae bacterium]|nr:geranylgeranyl reductase family protein [Bryobacteraceae bacterium]
MKYRKNPTFLFYRPAQPRAAAIASTIDGMTAFDVIVVGAGPAGATAARMLGEAGVSTLLLDKSSFPRDKPCGGGISARVLSRFPYLHDALAAIPVNRVNKVYFESPSGDAVDYRSDSALYLMIRRCEFDNLLFSLARTRVEAATAMARKVTVHPDHVSVGTDDNEYQARLVIGCDGANSVVARVSGLRSGSVQDQYAIDMMEETPYQELSTAERDRMYIYYRIRSHYGYGYVFPKTSHLNAGIGFKLDYYLSHLRGGHYAHHKAFVEDLTAKGLLAGASNPNNFRAFPLPISGPLPRTYGERVLLSGDAGGFVNALTAEGIYYAMVSGDHAARAAIAALRTGAPLSSYERAWRSEIGDELRHSVRLQKLLLSDPERIDRVIRAASRHPALADVLARYATGSITHKQFRSAMLRRALPVYLREKARMLFSI